MSEPAALPFRTAREVNSDTARPNRIRLLKAALYTAPLLMIIGPVIIVVCVALLCASLGQWWLFDNSSFAVAISVGPFLAFAALTVIATRKIPPAIDRELRRQIHTADLPELLTQAPVFYLRCFEEDDLISPMEGASLTSRKRIEESIVAAASQVGPVIALGRPGEDLPHVGANRFYVVDDDWRTAVSYLLPRCRYVIIVYHASPNVQWEVRKAFQIVPRDRLIFILPLPPTGGRLADWLRGHTRRERKRLLHASETMAHFTGRPLPDRSKRTEIIVFKDGAPIFLERRHSKTFKFIAWVYGVTVVCLIGSMVAVVAVDAARFGHGLSESITSGRTLPMLAIAPFIISLTALAVFDFSRYGSYAQMLEIHFTGRAPAS